MKRLLMVALLLLAACDRERGMERKTFELHRLSNDDALALLTPYIREGGMVSGKNRLITVREKPDRLKMIEELLSKYDGLGEAVDVVLDVQVIEADGFTTTDTAIADIEQTLRQTFRYRGYRLAGETHIQAREGTNFRRSIGNGFVMGQQNKGFMLEGAVDRVSTTGNEQRIPIQIQLRGPAAEGFVEVAGTVTGTVGKPTVLGQSTSKGAVILVIRPSLVKQ
jgi:hypothetical protein